MNNSKIVAFDFDGLVSAFDAAPGGGKNFDVAANLPAYRLWSSDADAIGGAIAYQYAKSGSLGSLTHDQMRAVLNSPSFGSAAQAIMATSGAMASEAGAGEFPDAVELSTGTAISAVNPDRRDAAAAERIEPTKTQVADVDALASRVEVKARNAELGLGGGAESPSSKSSGATAHEVSWRRIARDLPAFLGDCRDGHPGALSWPSQRAFDLSSSDATAPVVPAVGIVDTGRNRLLRFEGLSEGFAQIT